MSGPLRVDQVELVIRGQQILHPISIEFRAGEVTAVSGPSGSGKTSLLSVAGGLLAPTHGEVEYDGRPMWQGDGDPRPEVAFVLQVYGLVPILSAQENVAVALRARGVPVDRGRLLAPPTRSTASTSVTSGIVRWRSCPVVRCSGWPVPVPSWSGAAVLLADEPTSELDEGNREPRDGRVA